jgi:uncharacterized protein YicC (UPF0701 family)
MTDPTKQIETLNEYVNKYYNCNRQDGNELSLYLQKITALLYYLESVRSQIHNNYEVEIFKLVKEGNSVARAVNEANVKHPMMYQLRRIMDGGYRIADAIRTNISYLKSERQTTNQ